MRAAVAWLGRFAWFALQVTLAIPRVWRRPHAVGRYLYDVLAGCLPLALVAGAGIGIVAWLQLRGVLYKFQSEELLPSALALAVVWELGPVAAGLLAAARLGAGLSAELGSLRANEQIDALHVLGADVLGLVVVPRVLACVIGVPLLAILIDYVALGSSFAAEYLGGTLSWMQYEREWQRFLRLPEVLMATGKTVVFGFLVGICGCFCGLEVEGGAEGVGRAATKGVVAATLFVLIADVFLVRLQQLLLPGPG